MSANGSVTVFMKREYKDILSNINLLKGFSKPDLDSIYIDILPDSPKPRSTILITYKVAYELQSRAEGGLKVGNRTKLKRLASGKVKQPTNHRALQVGTKLRRNIGANPIPVNMMQLLIRCCLIRFRRG